MRIAHVNNIANVAWRLARAQRRLGHEAVVFALRDRWLRSPDVRLPNAGGPLPWNAGMFSRWRTFSDFDVLHVHGGIWKSQVFYPLFKRRFRWKTLAVHFHGSETRTGKGLHHLSSADVLFHSTPDLARWLPGSEWIPNPIDLEAAAEEPSNAVPRFGHFPLRLLRNRKGTDAVIELFRRTFGPLTRETLAPIARLRGREAELWIVSSTAHEEALNILAGCDAVIDQISPYGSYGMAAIEAMAFGKPVLGTFRPEWFPGCPILSPLADDAPDRMRAIVRDPDYRRKLGRAGRDYVAKVHESGLVARQVMKAYYTAMQSAPLAPAEVTAYWLRRGRTYASEWTRPASRERSRAQLTELMHLLRPLSFDSVAEVGCGSGRVGQVLTSERRSSWLGMDISRAQLAEARRRYPSLGPYVAEASASALPLADNTRDLVLAVEVLMHIPPESVGQVLRELWRVARRYVVHLDWSEDYLPGFGTGWCWVHDYPALWASLGATAERVRLRSTGIQSVFIVRKPVSA